MLTISNVFSEYVFWGLICILPGFFIFFGNELGGYVGPSGRGNITTETPGCLIKLFGYALLCVILVFLIIEARENGIVQMLPKLGMIILVLFIFFLISRGMD